MTIRDIPWTLPLRVTLSSGLDRTFSSVYEALDFLEHEWPLKRGERYDRAVACCQRALNRMTPPAVAREAFVAACLEAGMPSVMVVPPPSVRTTGRGRRPLHSKKHGRRQALAFSRSSDHVPSSLPPSV